MDHLGKHGAAAACEAPCSGQQAGAEAGGAAAPPRKAQRLEDGPRADGVTVRREGPFPTDALSSAVTRQGSGGQPDVSALRWAALSIPPPQPRYTDHLTHRLCSWPRDLDGRPCSCSELAADAMRQCGIIAVARVCCLRRSALQLSAAAPLLPPGLTHRVYAFCVHVTATAAARLRVRCGELAHVAAGLARAPDGTQHARRRCQMAEAVIARAYGGYCRRVQVRPCALRWLRALNCARLNPRCRRRRLRWRPLPTLQR